VLDEINAHVSRRNVRLKIGDNEPTLTNAPSIGSALKHNYGE
jgi:hypothetical protein